jgi:cobalt/nickel transport protein
MKTRTGWILAAVVLLTVLPLWLLNTAPDADAPGADAPGADAPSMFRGADDHAQQAIGSIAPGYRPWFAPVFQPASAEIASLLFALQAAAGAGVIGFWLGLSVARERARRDAASAQDRRAD